MNIIKKITIIFALICLFGGVKCFATSGTVNAPNGLVLRETASRTSNPITTINNSQTVEVIEKTEEWYKVKYNNYEGYLFAEYVNVSEPVVEENTEDNQKEEQTVENTESSVEPIQTEEQYSTYPKETTTLSNTKVYLVPSITASVINNIEATKAVTINKVVNAWAYITFENNSGWVRKSLLKEDNEIIETKTEEQAAEETDSPEKEAQTNFESRKGYINVSFSANVRESADKTAKIVTTLTTNTGVTIVGDEGDWYKITYGDYTGYISKPLISNTPIAETTSRGATTREIATTTENSAIETTDTTISAGEKLVSFAKQYLGYKYVYGGSSSSGFDCSGFVYYVYNSCGYSLSRLCPTQSTSGIAISRSELQQGDLVFFNNTSDGSIGHVGMYIGGGQFIHAANQRRGITTDTLNSGYYNTYYYSARRIIY